MSHAENRADETNYGWEGALDANAAALRRAAVKAGVPAEIETQVGEEGAARVFVRLTVGDAAYLYRRGALRVVSRSGRSVRHINGQAAQVTSSKGTTKAVLAAAGVSVPPGRVFDAPRAGEAVDYALTFATGACIKQENGAMGKLVFPQCFLRPEIEAAVSEVLQACGIVVVEQSVPGELYRFVYVEPGIVGARRMQPVSIVGDGKRTVLALAHAANAERRRRHLPGHDPIPIDLGMMDHLASRLLTLRSVPRAGMRISLSPIWSFARTGGEAVNIGEADIHPSYRANALAAFHAIRGLRVGAIDMKIADAEQPAAPDNHWVLEVNSSPAIESMATPWVGEPQDVAGAIVALVKRHAAASKASPASSAPQLQLDPHAVLLRDAAERRGIATRVATATLPGDIRQVQLRFSIGAAEYGYRYGALRRIDPGHSDLPGHHINGEAVALTNRKSTTKDLLVAAGLSVPTGRSFAADALEDAVSYAAQLGGAVCVKPECGKKGRRVTPNRIGADAVARAFRRVALEYDEVLVEQSVDGDELRFFYVAPRAVGVKMSVIPELTGDGRSTVLALLAEKNSREAALLLPNQSAVTTNHDLVVILAEQGLTLESVAEEGRRVRLRHVANGAGGGGHVECRDTIHPSFWEIADRAFHAIPGLVVASLDMKAKDSKAPAETGSYWILEINSNPGVLPYHYPWSGRPQDVSGAIIDYLIDQAARPTHVE